MVLYKKDRVYIIAEVGINHNGSLDNCYKLIDFAKEAGCDCVKFQLFTAKRLYSRSAGKIDWRNESSVYSYDIYDAVKSFELPPKWIGRLMDYCKHRGIDFLSSAFDEKGVAQLIRNKVRKLKISSSLITNIPFLENCSRYRVPLIISTGGATLEETDKAVRTINRYHNKVSLLHCTMKYPTGLSDCNLGVINTMRYAFPDNQIGYSDHTKEVSDAPIQAVYLGAGIIEKHITLDKKMKGPDHFFALEPSELKKMVRDIKRAEQNLTKKNIRIDKKIYGTTSKVCSKDERYLRDFCYMSIFAGKDIKKGERVKDKDLRILRPGKSRRGLEPAYIYLFKRYKVYAAKNIKAEEAISWGSIFNA